MDTFTIVLKEDVFPDPRKYGALLAPVLGVTVLEAKIAVRRGGIFAENLLEDKARRLAETLEGDGIGCWCVPSPALPPLRSPRRVTALKTLEEGLRCSLLGLPEPRLLPWDRIDVVSIGMVLVPELQEEVAGVRRKDVAAIVRREREQRDSARDRLLAVLTRVDPSHVENVPAAGAHHYFFDQLRRRDAKQLKAFADLVSDDGSDWWRIPLEETGFADLSDESAGRNREACNYLAVPVLYARRKDAHSERSLKLLQGGNVERLAFHTVEDFNRYTRWWTWRERLRAEPQLAEPSKIPAPSGNGRAPREIVQAPLLSGDADEPPRFGWRTRTAAAILILAIALAVGLRFERRGALCVICRELRQDDVIRVWGIPVRETQGDWKETWPRSGYNEIVGKQHAHLYTGFGYEREGLFGLASSFGRDSGGNASPEEEDAGECANGLLKWVGAREATLEEVKAAFPRLYERVRNTRNPAGRQRWKDLANAQPTREAFEHLLAEISK